MTVTSHLRSALGFGCKDSFCLEDVPPIRTSRLNVEILDQEFDDIRKIDRTGRYMHAAKCDRVVVGVDAYWRESPREMEVRTYHRTDTGRMPVEREQLAIEPIEDVVSVRGSAHEEFRNGGLLNTKELFGSQSKSYATGGSNSRGRVKWGKGQTMVALVHDPVARHTNGLSGDAGSHAVPRSQICCDRGVSGPAGQRG